MGVTLVLFDTKSTGREPFAVPPGLVLRAPERVQVPGSRAQAGAAAYLASHRRPELLFRAHCGAVNRSA